MTNRHVQALQSLAETFQTSIARSDWAAARDAGRKLATHLPENASVAYNLGLVEKSAGDLDQAIGAFQRALTLDPAHQNARFELAGCLMDTSRLTPAQQHYEIYITEKPDDAAALLNLGRVLLRLDQPGNALAHLERANALARTDDTMIALATGLRDLGRHDEAQGLLRQTGRTPEAAALRLKVMTQGARGRFSLTTG
jgi:tetratricopeptide (TPR) repeat protein